MNAAKWLGCGALAITFAACSKNTPPAETAKAHGELSVAEPSSPRDMQPASLTRRDSETTILLSEQFLKECQLTNTPQNSPQFDYADAKLHARGANILDDVSKCLREGPLKGRVITIIGHTDPRGTEEYNRQLSANRAEAARNYLVQRGVAANNVRIMARGEQDAEGTNEQSWALDRRVDFEIGDLTVQAENSPIRKGMKLQADSPGNDSKVDDAASYSDTAEGGNWTTGK
jgi:outer membrane protein OmpA-like peptidoglycan-associated protein